MEQQVFRRKRYTNQDFYLSLLPRIKKLARLHGYAIGLHGSLERDLDLIAVAWTERACEPQQFVEAVIDAVRTIYTRPNDNEARPKPHGRLAWSIVVGPGRYIDLSVIGPLEAREK